MSFNYSRIYVLWRQIWQLCFMTLICILYFRVLSFYFMLILCVIILFFYIYWYFCFIYLFCKLCYQYQLFKFTCFTLHLIIWFCDLYFWCIVHICIDFVDYTPANAPDRPHDESGKWISEKTDAKWQ
jgi:energy-coupling factor transporter transmembrane protein EcfT